MLRRVLLVGLVVQFWPAHVRPPEPPAGRVAFVSWRDGNPEIYSVRPDGSELTRLTHTAAANAHPDWSPDGRHIVFDSNRDRVMDTLPSRPGFGPSRAVSSSQLYIMDPDGRNVTRLTNAHALNQLARWSPDGRQVVFGSYRDEEWDLYRLTVANGRTLRLTYSAGTTTNAPGSWTRDGSRLLFSSTRDQAADTMSSIYSMDTAGRSVRRLSFIRGVNALPVVSPDGHHVAFQSSQDGHLEIYTMDIDGSHVTRLTTGATDNMEPTWSPDGRQIAFTGVLGGHAEIYIIGADGSGQRKLTESGASDAQASWH